MMDWHGAIDQRMLLSRFLNTDEGFEIAQAVCRTHLRSIVNSRGLSEPTDEDWEVIAQAQLAGLSVAVNVLADPDAPTYAITDDFGRLLLAAAESMPSWEVRSTDLDYPVAQSGVAYFLPPVPPAQENHTWTGGFIWSAIGPALWTVWLIDPFLEGERPDGVPRFLPVSFDLIEFGEQRVPDWPDQLVNIIPAFIALSKQRIAVTRSEHPPRPFGRRAGRAGLPDMISVVTLRRAFQRNLDSELAEGGEVHWSHRWLVEGHWRQQWYPTEVRHRPIWICAYVKGPEDKPLVIKRRVFAAVR